MSELDVDPVALEELAIANRILFSEGVLDGWGHVSVRHPTKPNRYLLSRALAPGLVTPGDIMEFDFTGEPVDPQGRRVYLERYIHAEIYRARSDVNAVVHSHSPSVIPFGITQKPMQPCFHMAAFLHTGVPVFEIRHASKEPTDLMITNSALGKSLAETLGDNSVALMRGHGNVVVAKFLEAAVARAIYTEINARLQATALMIGGPVSYLSHEEGEKMEQVIRGAGGTTWSYGRAYEVWKHKALGGKDKL